MTEKEYAQDLKTRFESMLNISEDEIEPKLKEDEFIRISCITIGPKFLEEKELNPKELKNEVEKLDYFFDSTKDINTKYCRKLWKKGQFYVFYKNIEDLEGE